MIVKKLSNPGVNYAASFLQKADLCMIKYKWKIKSLKNRKDENATHRFT